ncbi:c-type cytochrome [Sulfuritalea sp.]|uniref:c-type cytochrome n=1 Tax=Sulfuritalea sp. TaxID=2480090 RepID=UPI00286DB3A6|nr:c-type cytochrome [Sulfuritalea sp.]
MTMKWRGWALATGALAISAMAQAAPPTAAMLSNACAGCHGTNGGSAGPSMPSLAGQSKEAIVDAMKKFKSGARPTTVMGRLAKGFSDADFVAMGEYFSKQKLHATNQTLDKAKIAKGASLQETNCGRCHIEDGKEGKDDTPAMASQWLPYLQIQMADYLSGKRKMPEKMEEKVKPMSKQDLDALLHFYASVK